MGPTRELELERVAYVSNPEHHILLSIKRLAQSFDASMPFYPAGVVIVSRSGRRPPIFVNFDRRFAIVSKRAIWHRGQLLRHYTWRRNVDRRI